MARIDDLAEDTGGEADGHVLQFVERNGILPLGLVGIPEEDVDGFDAGRNGLPYAIMSQRCWRRSRHRLRGDAAWDVAIHQVDVPQDFLNPWLLG